MQRAKPSSAELVHVRADLGDEVRAGDPDVDDTVLHVLGDVVRPDEQEVDRSVLAGDVEGTLAELELKTCGIEQVERGLRHAPLGRNGDEQPVGGTGAHTVLLPSVRSSARR